MCEVRLTLDNEILQELGKSLALFNLLEHTLDELLTSRITLEGRAFERGVADILVSELSFKQKVSQIDSLQRFIAEQAEIHKGNPNANMVPSASKMLEQWTAIRKLLCVTEEERNRLVHSKWLSPAGITLELYQPETTTKPEGSATLEFGATGMGSPATYASAQSAIRFKVTARQGKGLVYRADLLTIEELKSINVQLGLVLYVSAMFSCYLRTSDGLALSEAIDTWLATMKEEARDRSI